jgi:putative acetyltransferase
MRIRAYRTRDLPALVALFRETVHAVGAAVYTPEELAAWAPADLRPEDWARRVARNRVWVADEDGGEVVGFAELSPEGAVDMLYVHKDRQGRGIARALLGELEAAARAEGLARLTTDASRIARPFFVTRGFTLVAAQEVERRGVRIENFRMEKALEPG